MDAKVFRASRTAAGLAIMHFMDESDDPSLAEVSMQIHGWLASNPSDTDQENVIYIAVAGKQGEPWAYRGVITLSVNSGAWWINDLGSLGGVGRLLADAAVTHAQRHPVGSAASPRLFLISLNEASTSFWEKQGFAPFGKRTPTTCTMVRSIAAGGAHISLLSVSPPSMVVASISSSEAVTTEQKMKTTQDAL